MNLVTGITQIAGKATALSRLAGLMLGGGPITLGSYVFKDYAVPENVRRGTTQRLTVHRYIGGGRRVQAMGPDLDPVEWSGTMLGIDAERQANGLEALCAAGQLITLTIGDFHSDCVIEKFSGAHAFHRVNYSISVVLVPPDAALVPDAASSVLSDLASSAAGLASVAAGVANTAGAFGIKMPWLSAASGAALSVTTLASATGGLVAGTAAIGATLASGQGALATIGTQLTAAGAALPSLTLSGAADVASAAVSSGASAALAQARGYVGRAVSNITSQGIF